MQIAGRPLLAAILLLALLAPGALRCQEAGLSGNGTWAKLSSSAYEASVDKNGSFSMDVDKGLSFKVSFIRCWVAYQRFPEIKLMRASRERASDGKGFDFRFQYQWDEGSVVESLKFRARGVEALYEFSPSAERDLAYVVGYVEPANVTKEAPRVVAMESKLGSDSVLDVLPGAPPKSRLACVSFRGLGPLSVDFAGQDSSSFSIESFPKLILRNSGPPGEWTTRYKPGEKLKVSLFVFLSSTDGSPFNGSAPELKD